MTRSFCWRSKEDLSRHLILRKDNEILQIIDKTDSSFISKSLTGNTLLVVQACLLGKIDSFLENSYSIIYCYYFIRCHKFVVTINCSNYLFKYVLEINTDSKETLDGL